MNTTSKHITIRGKEAQYLQLNDEGVDAVFYSANGFPIGTYSAFLKQLIPKYKLSCLPPRACWPNIGKPLLQTNWEVYADDLIAFVEQKYSLPIVAIGHSQGATAAIIAASKRPDLFESLILIEPASVSVFLGLAVRLTPYFIKKYFQPFKSGLEKQDIWETREAFFDYYREDRSYKRISDAVLKDFVEFGLQPTNNGEFTLTYPAQWEASNYALPPTIWKYLRKVELPIQVLAGKPSLFFTQDVRNEWKQRSSNSSIEINEKYGHLFPLEAPEICARMILWN